MKSKIKKQMEKNAADILFTMPSFINQLLLLLNSGVILHDAIEKIALSYESMDDSHQNYFTRQITMVYYGCQKSGENILAGFYKFGRFSGVKELARVANILLENQDKGTDLWDKLAFEGENLWKERKRLALERIHLNESKMSFPLGILLMSLIVITAAPAMLQM